MNLIVHTNEREFGRIRKFKVASKSFYWPLKYMPLRQGFRTTPYIKGSTSQRSRRFLAQNYRGNLIVLAATQNIFFEHVKQGVTFISREKTNYGH